MKAGMFLETRKEGENGKGTEICGFHEHLRFGTTPGLCPKEVVDS